MPTVKLIEHNALPVTGITNRWTFVMGARAALALEAKEPSAVACAAGVKP